MTSRRPSAAVAVVLLGVLLAGCAGEQPTGSEAGGHPSSSSEGARHPGSGTAMTGMGDMGHLGDDLVAPPDSAGWNLVDAQYLVMMIGHHRQALDMSRLAPGRAADPRVKALAAGIDRGQASEIVVMASWLDEHDQPVPSVEAVEQMAATGGMVGMLDAAQLEALTEARGADFDRLYLQGMIQHHQGAIGMAEEVLAHGEDQRVIDMAGEVIATQSGEIDRMRALLG